MAALSCVLFLPLYTSKSWSLSPGGTFKIEVNPRFFDGVTHLSGAEAEMYFTPAEEGPPGRVSMLTTDMVSELHSPSAQYYRAFELHLPAGGQVASVLSGNVPCPLTYLIIQGWYNYDQWRYGEWAPVVFQATLFAGHPITHTLLSYETDSYFFVVFNSSHGACPTVPLFMQLSPEVPAYRLSPSRRMALGQETAVPAGHAGMASVIVHTKSALRYYDVRLGYSRRPGELDVMLGLSIGLPAGLGALLAVICWTVLHVKVAQRRRLAGGPAWQQVSPDDGGAGAAPTPGCPPAGGAAYGHAGRSADLSPAPADGWPDVAHDPLLGGLPAGLATSRPGSPGMPAYGATGQSWAGDGAPLDFAAAEPPPPYSAEQSSSSNVGWSKY